MKLHHRRSPEVSKKANSEGRSFCVQKYPGGFNSGYLTKGHCLRGCIYLCFDLKEPAMDMLRTNSSNSPGIAPGLLVSVKLMDQCGGRENIAENSQEDPGNIFVCT
jgi:hypothetical protein